MQHEYKSIIDSITWDLVQNIIPGNWVKKYKTNKNGAIKNKARYVAKVFKQIDGLEYFDTFSPTSKRESFRNLLFLAARENLVLREMNVKSAYLHSKTEQEFY